MQHSRSATVLRYSARGWWGRQGNVYGKFAMFGDSSCRSTNQQAQTTAKVDELQLSIGLCLNQSLPRLSLIPPVQSAFGSQPAHLP